ncbi:MAG: serine hydrolase [Candidatus Eisenbacteria bacterium]|uniref:Serine hydrolase n=1 Tax=Eiseniibacteriota bacterium TaxID=2212470 RepID=A0A849SER9_UNCEI|nr:serine hydrolase [Candidatus Eisenbacteria bacterium]
MGTESSGDRRDALRRLLNHTSGTPDHEIDERETDPRFLVAPTRQDLLAWIATNHRIAPPGRTWSYTSDGFIAAALVAEQVTGSSYGDLIRRELAEPLGLDHFGFELEPRAQAYMNHDGRPVPVPAIPYAWFSGAGSTCGTLGDLAQWWMVLRGGRVLNAASLAALMTPVTLRAEGATAEFPYGLGIRLGR